MALRRAVFKLRCHATCHGGKRRHHPGKLVSGLAQPYRVPPAQGILNGRHVLRQTGPKPLTNLLQDDGVGAAGGQEDAGREQARQEELARFADFLRARKQKKEG